LLCPEIVKRRNTTVRPDSLDETSRVPQVDFAPTGVFRQVRRSRTPARPPAVVVDPGVRPSPNGLAHPRLVRRPRATPAPNPSRR